MGHLREVLPQVLYSLLSANEPINIRDVNGLELMECSGIKQALSMLS